MKAKPQKALLTTLEIGLIVVDLNPVISEPLRYGVLFGVQAATQNIWVAGLAFAVITGLLDFLGTIAIADLLRQKLTTDLMQKFRKAVAGKGFKKLLKLKTSFAVDVGITLLAGTPVTLYVKQQQDPDRSYEANMREGIILSIIGTVAAGLQGVAMVAGIWHPSAPTIIVAVLALASLYALQRLIKKKAA